MEVFEELRKEFKYDNRKQTTTYLQVGCKAAACFPVGTNADSAEDKFKYLINGRKDNKKFYAFSWNFRPSSDML